MPRYECERDDIPKKWHELLLIPGEGDEWILVSSNGIVDPSKNEVVMNDPNPEVHGTYEECSEVMERLIREKIDMGYHKIVNDDN